jgi:hypothetical protein
VNQQDTLNALAGRSADGKPLVFVAAADYHALREEHEKLLALLNRRTLPRWGAALVALAPSALLVWFGSKTDGLKSSLAFFVAGIVYMQTYAVLRGRGASPALAPGAALPEKLGKGQSPGQRPKN